MKLREQWKKEVKDRKKETQLEVPSIMMALPIIQWLETFQVHIYLACYVICENVVVPALCCPDHFNHQPYCEEHGSITGDLINHTSHDHGLYPKDNADVNFKLEEVTGGTPSQTAFLSPFNVVQVAEEHS